MYTFDEDLESAKRYEILTVKELNRKGFNARMNLDDFEAGTHPPDLYVNVNNKDIPIEVKHDIKSADTGNICFEVNALTNVDAKYLIVYSDKNYSLFAFKIPELLKELKEMQMNYKASFIPNSGDSKTYGWKKENPIYLVHISNIKNMKSKISNFPFDEQWKTNFKLLNENS